jgi:putative membrane protein
MVGSAWGAKDFLIGAAATALGFALVSLPRQEVLSPNLLIVFLVAAVAVCALVLPGVSGSFLLLAMGFYAPTIAAVNDLDLAYLGIFVAGAVFGLAVFAKLLRWLLVNRRRVTLVVMTGLMLGSLRALWPWQDESGRALEATSFAPIGYFLLGTVVIAVLTWGQSRAAKAQ